jgi:hypothetical protein
MNEKTFKTQIVLTFFAGRTFSYLIHSRNMSKQISNSTNKKVRPESVYYNYNFCMTLYRDH